MPELWPDALKAVEVKESPAERGALRRGKKRGSPEGEPRRKI